MPPRPLLETPRTVLVPQSHAAARALLAGEDPGFLLGRGYPHSDTLDALRMFADAPTGSEDGGWFITLRDAGTTADFSRDPVIGDCGTRGWVDAAGRVEIGFGLAAPFRGQGLGTEAVGALVGWLRSQSEVRSIAAEVEVGNLASRRLLERLDFALGETQGRSWWLRLPVPP